jgi:hypothetical protein
MLTHVVLFKFKPETTAQDIQVLAEGLGGLPEVIGEIREYRFGRDMLRTERSYDFALISSFDDLAAMQRYQVHPDHQKVLAHARAIAANVIAVDYTD